MFFPVADIDLYSDDTDSDSDMLSFLDDRASDADSDEDDSDGNMQNNLVRAKRRRPSPNKSASKKGANKTMQDKVMEEVSKQQSNPSTAELNPTALMVMCKRACEMKDELLRKLDALDDRLPSNTLDQLIDELGGPNEVAVRKIC